MIDLHAHVFPDGMAADTVKQLAARAGIESFSDGSAAGLVTDQKRAGIARSVNLPVATKPEQVRGINRWTVELREKYPSIVSFGAMHPRFAGFADELGALRERGVRGIKMHPDYQEFYPDDDALAPLYEACRDAGIAILFHAGADLAYPSFRGTAARFAQVLTVAGLTVVLAHMGGFRAWDGVEKHIIGTRAYLDTAVCYELGADRMRALVNAHGTDKVLFGTDTPWDRPERMIGFIRSLGLGPGAEEKIFEKNAITLLEGNVHA